MCHRIEWRMKTDFLEVTQCLAPLQRPVMVIFIQSVLSMNIWVSGPFRTKSDDVVSG